MMDFSDYPCRWRGEVQASGKALCASPKLIVQGDGVSPSTCARCYCRDHEPGARVDRQLRVSTQAKPKGRPLSGPGTELKKLLTSLGLAAQAGCGCEDYAWAMDSLGANGCEAHREQILARLRASADQLGWLAKIKAAALAMASGLALRLDPLDPAPGLLDEALRRARDNAS